MKLKVLGIDSMEFDFKRRDEIWTDINNVRKWLQDPSIPSYERNVCESAAILDKLSSRNVPLVQYRGLTFEDPSVADAVLGGKMVLKRACESFTPSVDTAEYFVTEEGPQHAVRLSLIHI